MIFDSHTHVQFPAFTDDQDAVIQRARAAAVKMIVVGTNLITSQSALAVAEKYPEAVWATVGFHPSHVGAHWHFDKNELTAPVQENFSLEALRQLAVHPQVVAIGECGLDFYRVAEPKIKAEQKAIFLEQIKLAEALKKPLMIHCRPAKDTADAYDDLRELLQFRAIAVPKIIHFFVGSLAIAQEFLQLGCSFTFGGAITFGHAYDQVIQYLPLENILLETDAPYVAPAPYRGRRNEPAYVIEVAKKIAALKNLSLIAVAAQTTANTKRIFKI